VLYRKSLDKYYICGQNKKQPSLLFSFHEPYIEKEPKWNAFDYMEVSERPFGSNNVLSKTNLLGNFFCLMPCGKNMYQLL
jgi:hypothetical protein